VLDDFRIDQFVAMGFVTKIGSFFIQARQREYSTTSAARTAPHLRSIIRDIASLEGSGIGDGFFAATKCSKRIFHLMCSRFQCLLRCCCVDRQVVSSFEVQAT
jgi:hypothetical protein